ncbi:single-stranded DNA-binding protein [Cryobacterium tepidiphilum]|nr:single-stranded DNA-binding protein [Cryobacterium tepidiphilum]
MNDMTTVTGVVGTPPKHYVTASGLPITTFRLASGLRRFDKDKKAWVDAGTNWYNVSGFRHLAFNLARSINKGDHVLVTGRLKVRNWEKDDKRGTSMDLEADAVGHDLFWCTTTPVRSAPSPASAAQAAADAAVPDREAEPMPRDPFVDRVTEPRPVAGDGFLPSPGNEMRGLADVDS